jgi:hypothetical protein
MGQVGACVSGWGVGGWAGGMGDEFIVMLIKVCLFVRRYLIRALDRYCFVGIRVSN